MRRFVLLPLFLVLSLDFALPDAPLYPNGPRAAQWDDEEESVPSRVVRVRRAAPQPNTGLPGQRVVAPARTVRRPQHVAGAAPRLRPPEWSVPLSHARLSSPPPASSPEDH